MNWNKEDIEFVEKAIEIRNKGYYIDGGQLTEVYNRVLEKRVSPTNCGSCIRQRINELEGALSKFKRLSEASKVVEVDNTKVEENNALTDSGNDALKARMARVRAAKNKKK